MKSIEQVNVSFMEYIDDLTINGHYHITLLAINIAFGIILLGLFLLLKLKKTNKDTIESHIDFMIHIAGFVVILTSLFIVFHGFRYVASYKSLYMLHQPVTGTVTDVEIETLSYKGDTVRFKTKEGQKFKINVKESFNFPEILPRSSNYLNTSEIAKGDKVKITPKTKYTFIKDHTFEDDKTNNIKITNGPHHKKEMNKRILIFHH